MLMKTDEKKTEVEVVDVSVGLKIQTNLYEVIGGKRKYLDLGYFPVEIPYEKILGLLTEPQKKKILDEARKEYKEEIKLGQKDVKINK